MYMDQLNYLYIYYVYIQTEKKYKQRLVYGIWYVYIHEGEVEM